MIYKDINDIPENCYECYLIDFPWRFNKINPGNSIAGVSNHYPTMTIKEIYEYCDILKTKIPENAVCFSWINTNYSKKGEDLARRLLTFDRMGFRNVGQAFIWEKTTKKFKPLIRNTGHYSGNSTETCYLGIKGSVSSRQASRMWRLVYQYPRIRPHSTKPPIFRNLIEGIYPDMKRIELFGRQKVNRWDVFGNQV